MNDYRFSLIVRCEPMTHDEILDVTDAIGAAGCTDASLRGHAAGFELLFERTAESLQDAIGSAISDVERAGYRVSKIEIQREAISV